VHLLSIYTLALLEVAENLTELKKQNNGIKNEKTIHPGRELRWSDVAG